MEVSLTSVGERRFPSFVRPDVTPVRDFVATFVGVTWSLAWLATAGVEVWTSPDQLDGLSCHHASHQESCGPCQGIPRHSRCCIP